MSLTSNIGLVDDSSVNWMHLLVEHYRSMRSRYPDDTLAVVFDIDGTIVDTRHLIMHTLIAYDRAHGTSLFRSLHVDDVDVHEAEVEALLDRLAIEPDVRSRVVDFYFRNLWTHDALLAAHHPYRGVMEVIRWFQLQRRTVVALNTGRPEQMRAATLTAMNELGREYRVSFADNLLLMNPGGWGQAVVDSKNAAIDELRARGLRIAAIIDNEPENLEAMALADPSDDVLYLHASTIFLSARRNVPRSVSGERYDLRPFVSEEELQGHVQLVWGDITEPGQLQAFLDASIGWLSVPVRLDRYGRPEIGRQRDGLHAQSSLDVHDVLALAAGADRGIRLDMQMGGVLVDRVLGLLRTAEAPRSIWISGEFHELGERGIRMLRAAAPDATVSCTVDFIAPLMFGALEHAVELLDVLRDWGVDRLGITWGQPKVREFIGELERWGREVDVAGIDDAESMLQAALLLPRSVTATSAAFSLPAAAIRTNP